MMTDNTIVLTMPSFDHKKICDILCKSDQILFYFDSSYGFLQQTAPLVSFVSNFSISSLLR